jgi:hypothetical protein
VCGEDYRAEAAARSLTGDEEKVVGNGHQGSSTRALEHCLFFCGESWNTALMCVMSARSSRSELPAKAAAQEHRRSSSDPIEGSAGVTLPRTAATRA